MLGRDKKDGLGFRGLLSLGVCQTLQGLGLDCEV